MKHCGLGTDYIRPDHTYSMLSRYNGIGSLKLSIATAQNQRTSNPYITDVTRMDMAGHRNDVTNSTYGDLPNDCSPTTKAMGRMHKPSDAVHAKNQINDLKAKAPFNLSRKPPKNRQKVDKKHNPMPNTAAQIKKQQKSIPKITSTNSIYSTSTISNSSLQEYDDNELDTMELAKYMRQINNNIHHDGK